MHGRFTLVRITSESIQRMSMWYGQVLLTVHVDYAGINWVCERC